MRLSKKNIGQLFDCRGSDGSWYYQLLDIKDGNLLFYSQNHDYWILKNKYADWQYFKLGNFKKDEIARAWKLGRISE